MDQESGESKWLLSMKTEKCVKRKQSVQRQDPHLQVDRSECPVIGLFVVTAVVPSSGLSHIMFMKETI